MGTTQKKKKSKRSNPAKQSSSQSRTWLIIGAVAVGVIGLGVILYLALRPAPEIQGVATFPRPSRGHNASLQIPFGELPPTGGEHNPQWQNCGIYEEPVEAQYAVHSLEHGAVWITYQPDLAADQVSALQEAVRGRTFLLLSPYPEQRSPIVLTAWGIQLEVDDASDKRIEQFIERYRVGPQTPERGAVCTNGLGEPLS